MKRTNKYNKRFYKNDAAVGTIYFCAPLRQLRTVLWLIAILSVSYGCEAWDESAEVSHLSYIPTFELEQGQYLSYVVNELDTFIDPGAQAFVNQKEISVNVLGDTAVHVNEVGLYTIVYYAFNSDGLLGTENRYVSITNKDISGNDLSGNYIGTNWSPIVEMKVSAINNKGFYKCSEVMGFPGAGVKGEFVDLGGGDLVLLPGDGYFGRYAASEGRYTLSSLSWTIGLQEEPYDGVSIDVIWIKDEE